MKFTLPTRPEDVINSSKEASNVSNHFQSFEYCLSEFFFKFKTCGMFSSGTDLVYSTNAGTFKRTYAGT